MIAAGALDNPFMLPSSFVSRKFPDTKARAIERPSILTGNVGVLIVAGQSLGANTVNAAHTVVNTSKVHNLNIFDGGLYAMVDPLLGTDFGAGNLGNLFTRVADGLVTAGVFNHVVIVPTSAGGTTVAEWVSTYWQNIIVANRRLAALGLVPTALLWQQGESDNVLGTSSASYQSSFTSMLGKIQGAGIVLPWFLAKSTRYNNANSTAIRSAIDALVAGGPNFYAGADTDSVTSRMADGTHFDNAGANSASALWVAAIDSVL